MSSLQDCPEKPNCVSSQASQASHFIPPIALQLDAQDQHAGKAALVRLRGILNTLPGATVIHESEHYLYTEFKSKLFGFIDDVEFLYQPGDPHIHVRSASRVGHSDLGVNQRRVETVRQLFHAPIRVETQSKTQRKNLPAQ
jgi:uncharacterized protein (DUF1499 family)